jgi:hypothetical protein
MVGTVIRFKADQSLVVCYVERFSSASCSAIITHFKEDTILAVKSDLANITFFFSQDDIDLTDMIHFVKIERFIANISTNLTS